MEVKIVETDFRFNWLQRPYIVSKSNHDSYRNKRIQIQIVDG